MAKRESQEINAGSMADIAFLLLIFFLVTTTMDVDSGITRKLPPWEDDPDPTSEKINERNVYVVLINSKNQLLVEGEIGHTSKLTEGVKEFITNPKNKENLSENRMLSEIKDKLIADGEEDKAKKFYEALKLLGDQKISKGVVSLQNDRGTQYGTYLEVQNELVKGFNQLRDELAMQKFGSIFDECSEEQQEAIKTVYPLAISEAEPKNIGGKK